MPFTRLAGAARPGLDGVGRSWWAAVTRAAQRIRQDADGGALDVLAASAATLLGAPVSVAILEEESLLVRRAISGGDRGGLGAAVAALNQFQMRRASPGGKAWPWYGISRYATR